MENGRELILTFLNKTFESGKIYTSYQTLKFKYNDIHKLVIEETKYLDELDRLISFNERLYHIINNLYNIQRCKICGTPVRFVNYNTGYNKYCSSQCSYLDPDIKDKRKNTNLKIYGVDNPLKNKDIVEKRKNTLLEKYGVSNISQLDDIKNKKLFKSLEKYGTEYVFQSEEVKSKIRETLLDKYNVDNISKSEYFQILKKKAYYLQYGVDHFKQTHIEAKKEEYNVELLEEYIHYRYLHKWKCLKCGNTFDATWHYINRVNGESCPHCYGYPNNTSKKEKEVFSFIRELLPSDIEIIENAKILEGNRELDIFIPSMNIAFEFDGLHWHSDSFHQKNYHVLKTDECNRKGIRLIHIFEDEWEFKADICKGRIKQILNTNISSKIYARKCIIREIDKKSKDQFLLNYHLQSYDVASSVMLGAFYNDELVSVMTFTHGSVSKGIKTQDKLIWELNRFCTNYNYHIIGIASKMLSYFKRNYEWNEIFSYADRRWSQGDLYEKLGFEFVKNTGINYWIIVSGMRKHRFNIQENNNHEKIYDCGSSKYVLRKE